MFVIESQTVCVSDHSPWILNGLLSSLFDSCDISDDEDRMAVDIFFKPRIEADGTEQHRHFVIQESKRAQNRVQVTCIITVCSRYFLYQFYFTPEHPS